MARFLSAIELLTLLVASAVAFNPLIELNRAGPGNNVVCPDRQAECPDRNTCCQLSSGQYGCCPLSSAVCCSDGIHCCPEGYSCDSSASCTKGLRFYAPQLTYARQRRPIF